MRVSVRREDINVEKTNELISNSTVKSLEQKPLNFSQKLNENTKDRTLKESTMNDKNINLNKDQNVFSIEMRIGLYPLIQFFCS
jgi:hypothetical protein